MKALTTPLMIGLLGTTLLTTGCGKEEATAPTQPPKAEASAPVKDPMEVVLTPEMAKQFKTSLNGKELSSNFCRHINKEDLKIAEDQYHGNDDHIASSHQRGMSDM
jgi:hypothetical protein